MKIPTRLLLTIAVSTFLSAAAHATTAVSLTGASLYDLGGWFSLPNSTYNQQALFRLYAISGSDRNGAFLNPNGGLNVPLDYGTSTFVLVGDSVSGGFIGDTSPRTLQLIFNGPIGYQFASQMGPVSITAYSDGRLGGTFTTADGLTNVSLTQFTYVEPSGFDRVSVNSTNPDGYSDSYATITISVQPNIAGYQALIASLNQKLADDDALIASLQSQITSLQSQLGSAQTDRANLQTQLDAANATITTLNSQLATANGDKASLQTQLDAANAANATLQNKLDAANATITDLNAQLAAANAAKADLQAQLTAANTKITDLNSQLAAANLANAGLQTQLANANAQIAALQSSLDAANAQIAQLQGSLADAKATITSDAAQISSLKDSLSAANAQIASLTADLSTATVTINSLNSTIAQMNASESNLSTTLATAFNDPNFKLPGATPTEQLANLVTAIGQLNHGQQQALYTNLGGKPGNGK